MSDREITKKPAEQPAATTPAYEEFVEPAVDVLRTDDEVRVIVDMPGVTQEGLNLSVHDGVLKIRATCPRGEGLTRRYERAFRVGRRVDGDAITAHLAQGVLTLCLPIHAHAKPRQITVNAG